MYSTATSSNSAAHIDFPFDPTAVLGAVINFPLQQPVAIFLLVLAIILVVPIVFNRLRIPYIVGMIVAGTAVGPYGFNILDRDASFQIFGQVGILYLMFLAAVEIDMYHLRQNMRRGLIFGILSFLLPLVGGLAVGRWLFHASWPTSLLIASMLSSHTLISYPVINRFGLSNQKAVVISVCGTIVAVLLSLVLLAQVVAIGKFGALNIVDICLLLAAVAIYADIVGTLFPWLTRRFFRRHSEPVTQFIFVLLLVLLASLLAQFIGLEAILGAFYAGLVLNRFIPARSPLMNRIQFVGNAIFIPYFLIGVGMLINVGVIFRGWGVLEAAAAMTAAALVGKWAAAYISQKIFRIQKLDRKIMFGLSSGKAAATIAATMVGFQYGLLSEDLLNGAVIMILMCCLVASFTTERGAIKLRVRMTEDELADTTSKKRGDARQLVAVANPMTAESIMKLALMMRHPNNRLPIHAMFVRNSDDARIRTAGEQSLQIATETANAVDLGIKTISRFDNNIVNAMTNVMREENLTDIIIGMHRRSTIVDSFYGKLTEQLLAQNNRMVIMSRCFIPINTIKRIIVLVPQKGEYETGFRKWVQRIGNLSTQLSCPVEFIAYPTTVPYIRSVLSSGGYDIKVEYLSMRSWDDFIILSSRISEDDLFVAVGARRTSVSYSSDLENLPGYLQRFFARQNLVVIYPEQFGDEADMPIPLDPLTVTIGNTPATFTGLKRLFKKK